MTGGKTAQLYIPTLRQTKEKERSKENRKPIRSNRTRKREKLCFQGRQAGYGKEELDYQVNALQDQKYELENQRGQNQTQLDSYKEKLWEDLKFPGIQAMEFKSRILVSCPPLSKKTGRSKAESKSYSEYRRHRRIRNGQRTLRVPHFSAGRYLKP